RGPVTFTSLGSRALALLPVDLLPDLVRGIGTALDGAHQFQLNGALLRPGEAWILPGDGKTVRVLEPRRDHGEQPSDEVPIRPSWHHRPPCANITARFARRSRWSEAKVFGSAHHWG